MRVLMRFVVLFCLMFAGIGIVSAQEIHKGILLFNEGKFKNAGEILSAAVKTPTLKNDATLWNYLGLSFHQQNEVKKAINSFNRAVKLDPKSSVFRTNLAYSYLLNRQTRKAKSATDAAIKLDASNVTAYHLRGTIAYWDAKYDAAAADASKAIELNPGFAPAYRLEADVSLGRLGQKTIKGETIRENISLIESAIETLERGLKNSSDADSKSELDQHLASIKAFQEHFSKPAATSLEAKAEPDPNVVPYRILSKPKATYTDRARTAGTQGTVRIVLLLGADGRIGPMLILSRLPNGLTEQAVAAARQIRFEPKTVSGKPAPTVVTIEYGFNIY